MLGNALARGDESMTSFIIKTVDELPRDDILGLPSSLMDARTEVTLTSQKFQEWRMVWEEKKKETEDSRVQIKKV